MAAAGNRIGTIVAIYGAAITPVVTQDRTPRVAIETTDTQLNSKTY